MSIYRKDEYGNVVRVAGNIVQRWNNRIFTTTHRVDDGKDYYDIDISANKFIIELTPYTFFQLHLDALNISSEIYITFNGQTLRVKQSNGEPILPGTLNRIKLFYTFDLEVAEIWYDSPLELLSPEVKLLYENNPNTNVFTDAEKSKLAGLESSKFVGQFLSLSALQAAFPTALIGSYALVDGGPTIRTKKYLWDSDDFEWVLANDPLQELTPAQVKTLYEENLDTNAFTDANKVKLNAIKDYTEIITKTDTGNVSTIINFAQDISYVNNISSLTITLPISSEHGYYGSVNFKTGSGELPIDIINVNEATYPLKIMKYDKRLFLVELSANKTVNIVFYCDGINMYCYYTEV